MKPLALLVFAALVTVTCLSCANGSGSGAPLGGTWTEGPRLLTARHGLASAAVDGRLYVIAGGRCAGLAASDTTEIFTPE